MELIVERLNAAYVEPYYNGKDRHKNDFKKITGDIPLNKIPNNSVYSVIEILNQQPHSVGVLSYSLFGDYTSERFRTGLIEPLLYNAKEMKTELPGWSARIYIAKNISDTIMNELIDAGYELYIMNVPTKDEGYVWRFLPASENKPFVSHDADMRFSEIFAREPSIGIVVKNWLKTTKPFLRRKYITSTLFNIKPILAGMWGSRPEKNGDNYLVNIKELLEKYNFKGYGMDEAFLTKEIWPKMKENGYYSSGWKTELLIVSFIAILAIIILVGIIVLIKNR